MESSGRKAAKFILLFLAFVTAISGFVTITLWNRIFTPELYTSALNQSDIYAETTNVIEDQVTFYLTEKGKELVDSLVEENINAEDDDQNVVIREVAIWLLNTIIENQTPVVVENASEQIQLEQNLQGGTEMVITGVLGWVRGDVADPQVFNFIPSVEEAEDLGTGKYLTDFVSDIAYSAFGIEERPECSSTDQEVEALRLVEDGNWREVECTSEKVRKAVLGEIENILPMDAIEEWQANLEEKYDLYALGSLLQGAKEIVVDLAKVKEGLIDWRSEIQAVRYGAIFSIIASFFFIGGAILISAKRSFKTALWLYMWVGLAMMAGALLFNLFAVNFTIEQLNITDYQIQSEAVSDAQILLWEQSVEDTVRYFVEHVNDYTIEIGFMLFIFTAIPLALIGIWNRGGKEKVGEAAKGIEERAKHFWAWLKDTL